MVIPTPTVLIGAVIDNHAQLRSDAADRAMYRPKCQCISGFCEATRPPNSPNLSFYGASSQAAACRGPPPAPALPPEAR